MPDPAVADCVVPAGWASAWFVSNLAFTAIFVLEMALKLVAYGGFYLYDVWNVFDGFIVFVSVLDIAIDPRAHTYTHVTA